MVFRGAALRRNYNYYYIYGSANNVKRNVYREILRREKREKGKREKGNQRPRAVVQKEISLWQLNIFGSNQREVKRFHEKIIFSNLNFKTQGETFHHE